MDNELQDVFNLRLREIGETGAPLNRPASKKDKKDKIIKNKEFAIFLDKDGNAVEPGSKGIVYGEIWTYDENGDVTRTYVGDSWTSSSDNESDNNNQTEQD